MFTPQYCVSSLAKSEAAAASATSHVHASSASREGSIESTCVCVEVLQKIRQPLDMLFDRNDDRPSGTPGLPAWAIIDKFGNPSIIETEIVRGPSAASRPASGRPPLRYRPAASPPLALSKPVAKMTMSSS